MGKIKVMLVDDNAELRRCVRTLVEQQEDMTVSAECSNGLEALEALGKHGADVIVLDIIMPQMDGYSFLEALGEQQPERCRRLLSYPRWPGMILLPGRFRWVRIISW